MKAMAKTENTGARSRRNDIILIVCVLAVAVAGLIYLNFFRSPGNMVTVTVDGEYYGSYSLDDEICEDIYTGENKENYNRLVISGGNAYMEKASCPDGICVDHRSVFRDGESIVCLPNRVVITVTSDKDNNNPDIVI